MILADGLRRQRRFISLALLAAAALFPGLGSAGRLTYHEAFVAQGAREMLASGNWAYPTIGGLPWLEKPPLPWWLVTLVGHWVGSVDETVARFPSALAAIGTVIGVGVVATRHYGSSIGLLAGAVQATTAWTVIRGRLAEADVLLVSLITWAIVAFDQLLSNPPGKSGTNLRGSTRAWRYWRWVFMIFFGASALVKGIGFGAVLILAVIGGMILWQRDVGALRRLWLPAGWVLVIALAAVWPLIMVVQHGHVVISLWKMHAWARLIRQDGPGLFAGESWSEYVVALLAQGLPWTPLALAGAWGSVHRALGGGHADRGSRLISAIATEVVTGDRLLCIWAVVPLSLLALVPVKNAHYAISAQVPWSIWAALALARLGAWLCTQGYHQRILFVGSHILFTSIALTYGLGLWSVGPWVNGRGVEWAFYEAASQKIPTDMHVALLYDDWDRNPYSTPFGSIPHDLAVRLFYLSRSVCWHLGPTMCWPEPHALGQCSARRLASAVPGLTVIPAKSSFAVIGRNRDLPLLEQLGCVDVVFRGPEVRRDRTYALFRVVPRVVSSRLARERQRQTSSAHTMK